MLHPYGLFIFAIFYNFSLRGSITFCEYWNPINSIADMLISTPGTDQPQSKIDEGIINYPQPLTTIADLLISNPDPVIPTESSTSTHESTPLTTTPHALQGERLPLPLTPDDAFTLRGIMGAPVNEYFCTSLRTSATIHEINCLAYGPLSNIFPPEDSLAFEPALSDSSTSHKSSQGLVPVLELSPLQQCFNDFIPLVERAHGEPTVHDMREYINYVRDTMPEELWSKTEAELFIDGTDITNLINGLDHIIILPNKGNAIDLIYYKTAISVYNVVQLTDKVNNAKLFELFEHTLTLYTNHYLSSNKP